MKFKVKRNRSLTSMKRSGELVTRDQVLLEITKLVMFYEAVKTGVVSSTEHKKAQIRIETLMILRNQIIIMDVQE